MTLIIPYVPAYDDDFADFGYHPWIDLFPKADLGIRRQIGSKKPVVAGKGREQTKCGKKENSSPNLVSYHVEDIVGKLQFMAAKTGKARAKARRIGDFIP